MDETAAIMIELMKYFAVLILVIAGTFGSGCTTGVNGPALDPVGPPVHQSKTTDSANGNLTVYSAHEINADFNTRDPYRPEFSNYKIYNPDGRLYRHIHNNSGTKLQDPAAVSLPPGKYQVSVRANGYGTVTVPVLIEPNQNTVLHLEGGGSWPDESGFNQTNAVRLPDGQIVG